ncbi:MAG: type II toxin-antitoxin system Phd/YefM family antitoxin [Sideroxyarcus sp.]|nr:type II toxin-antitoxin system Phd/YefM family antitoxin [Sideroxyarcus sp.]
MKTITAKEAKTRLGQAIDLALSEGEVMITKNGRDSVVLVSAERYRQLTQGFIEDECVEQKKKNRAEFADMVRTGKANAMDASMFHGEAAGSKIRMRDNEF